MVVATPEAFRRGPDGGRRGRPSCRWRSLAPKWSRRPAEPKVSRCSSCRRRWGLVRMSPVPSSSSSFEPRTSSGFGRSSACRISIRGPGRPVRVASARDVSPHGRRTWSQGEEGGGVRHRLVRLESGCEDTRRGPRNARVVSRALPTDRGRGRHGGRVRRCRTPRHRRGQGRPGFDRLLGHLLRAVELRAGADG